MSQLRFWRPMGIQFASAAILALLFGVTSGYAESIRVGYFLLPPLVMEKPDGSAEGAAVSLFRKLADQMGVETVILRPYPLKRLLHALEMGALDAALTLGKNPERAKKFAYPERPFFRMRSALVVRMENALTEIRSPEDLRNLRIGIYADGFMSPTLKEPGLDRVPLTDSDVIGRALAMVRAGHLDAFYSPDEVPLEFRIQRDGHEKKLRIVRLPEPPEGLFTVFSRPGGERFLGRYEAAMDRSWSPEIMRDHLVQAIQEMEGEGSNATHSPETP